MRQVKRFSISRKRRELGTHVDDRTNYSRTGDVKCPNPEETIHLCRGQQLT
jgi:hypothetical protein